MYLVNLIGQLGQDGDPDDAVLHAVLQTNPGKLTTWWNKYNKKRCCSCSCSNWRRAHTHLQEARDVSDDISEHVVVLLTVEPAQLGDSGVQLDQSLGHERR